MRILSCIAVGLTISAAFPAAAAPGAIRFMPPAPPLRPVYGPPTRPIYGPPQGYSGVHHGGARILVRQGGRYVKFRGNGYGYGLGYGYAPALPSWGYYSAPAVVEQDAPEVYTPDAMRPRSVIYNLPPPPLGQGDIGYVAKPAIYEVREVLRRYPPGRFK